MRSSLLRSSAQTRIARRGSAISKRFPSNMAGASLGRVPPVAASSRGGAPGKDAALCDRIGANRGKPWLNGGRRERLFQPGSASERRRAERRQGTNGPVAGVPANEHAAQSAAKRVRRAGPCASRLKPGVRDHSELGDRVEEVVPLHRLRGAERDLRRPERDQRATVAPPPAYAARQHFQQGAIARFQRCLRRGRVATGRRAGSDREPEPKPLSRASSREAANSRRYAPAAHDRQKRPGRNLPGAPERRRRRRAKTRGPPLRIARAGRRQDTALHDEALGPGQHSRLAQRPRLLRKARALGRLGRRGDRRSLAPQSGKKRLPPARRRIALPGRAAKIERGENRRAAKPLGIPTRGALYESTQSSFDYPTIGSVLRSRPDIELIHRSALLCAQVLR